MRMHDDITHPCMFGCQGASDHTRHYLQRGPLWQTAAEALGFATDNGLLYFETSAKEGICVEEAFHAVVSQLLDARAACAPAAVPLAAPATAGPASARCTLQ